MAIQKLSIVNWQKYNPRKDIKRPSWFALSNTILRDPDLESFTCEELIVWIHCLCLASESNDENITFDTKYLTVYRGLPESVQTSALKKLSRHGHLTQIRTRHVRNPYATGQDRTEHNKTTPHNPPWGAVRESNENSLIQIWNENCGPLPKVISDSASRAKASAARLDEEKNLDVWVAVVKRIAASAFCCGNNDRRWQANFDWLLKPDTRLKVLEGKYDSRDSKSNDLDEKRKREERIRELSGVYD